jgi:hypothetical protein
MAGGIGFRAISLALACAGAVVALLRVEICSGGNPKALRVHRRIGPFGLRSTEIRAERIQDVLLRAERFSDHWVMDDSKDRAEQWHYIFCVWLRLRDGGLYQISNSSCLEAERDVARRIARRLGVSCEEEVVEGAAEAARAARVGTVVSGTLCLLIFLALLVAIVYFEWIAPGGCP